MKKFTGFTLIEMLVVIAILAILAALAFPTYLYKIIQGQIEAALPLAQIAQRPTELAWLAGNALPIDNASAGLPAADKIVNNYVSSVSVDNGVVSLTFGNHANGAIRGKILSWRPAMVDHTHQVPVTWVCAAAAAPANMQIQGTDHTTLPVAYLPPICRAQRK